jgi:hypothetical protein
MAPDDIEFTIKTADGEEFDQETEREMTHNRSHTDPDKFKEAVRQAETVADVADYLDASKWLVWRWADKHGIDLPHPAPRTNPQPDVSGVSSPELDDPPKNSYTCPECGREYETAEAESACLRSHATDRAEMMDDVDCLDL